LKGIEERENPGNYLAFRWVAFDYGITSSPITAVPKGAGRIAYRKAGDRRKSRIQESESRIQNERVENRFCFYSEF
jgi:hypothetical protein